MATRRSSHRSQRITPLLIALLLALTALSTQTLSVAASEIRTGDDPSVATGETVNDDLYIFGGDVAIAGTINGDAIVSAGNVDVNGRIDGSLMVIAGQVEISGTVERAVRVAAGDVIVTGNIGGDLIVAGGRVTVERNGAVGGDLVAAGGNVTILGPVDGNVRGQISQLRIDDQIGGDVRVSADEIDLDAQADIAGEFDYSSPKTADFADGASVTGAQTHQETTRFNPGSSVTDWFLSPLIRLIWALVTGFLLIMLIPRATAVVADGIRHAPASSFVLGLVMLIAIPVASLILLVTIIGIPFAVLLWLSYAIVLYLSQIFLGLALGRIILPKSWDTNGRGYNLLAMTLGVVFLAALRIIPFPFVATAISALTAIFGLGAIILGPRRWRSQPVVPAAY